MDNNNEQQKPGKAWGTIVPDFTKARLEQKPRPYGLTMLLDRCQGLASTEDILMMAGSYIDHIKLSFGTSALLDESFLRRKIELVRSYHIEIYPGGTMMEIAHVQGCIPKCIKRSYELGFTAVEISDGTIELPRQLRNDTIRYALDVGLKVITEVGKKDPTIEIPPAQMCEQIEEDLALGAERVIIEARESGTGIGIYDQKGQIILDKVTEILECLDEDKHNALIWEAPRSGQQASLILLQGPNVNLGNIRPSDVLGLESLRRGLRFETFRHFAPQLEPKGTALHE